MESHNISIISIVLKVIISELNIFRGSGGRDVKSIILRMCGKTKPKTLTMSLYKIHTHTNDKGTQTHFTFTNVNVQPNIMAKSMNELVWHKERRANKKIKPNVDENNRNLQ